MAPKSITSIGIEHDNLGIRAAKVSISSGGEDTLVELNAIEEVRGAFENDKDLIDGIESIKDKMGHHFGDRLATCVTGKQIYAAQTRFRILPDEELRSALRFEMRKSLPFDVSGSVLEYQIIEAPEKKADKADMLVTVVGSSIMQKHLQIFEKAGLKPDIVDIIPTAAANSFWSFRRQGIEPGIAHVILHLSPSACTLVFDGDNVTFFTRSIPFAAHEVFGTKQTEETGRDNKFRLDTLIDEVVRSLSFYEKTYRISKFAALHPMGEYVCLPEALNALKNGIGLPMSMNNDYKKFDYSNTIAPGKFDIALALAMRSE